MSGKRLNSLDTLDTFSAMGKEIEALEAGREIELFRRAGRGVLTHMWFAMDPRVRIRVYVDGEAAASIDMAMDMGHGYAFGGSPSPSAVRRWGGMGDISTPTTSPTATGCASHCSPRPLSSTGSQGGRSGGSSGGRKICPLWSLVSACRTGRGCGCTAWRDTRPSLWRSSPCATSPARGLLYLVTIAAESLRDVGDWKDISYMEGCIRAYLNGGTEPQYLSSGLEDYFLGSGYFHQNQLYYGAVAGLTFLDAARKAFSAYRFHDDDPIFFRAACG